MPDGPYYLGEGRGSAVFRMWGFGLGFQSGKVWEQMGQPCLALTMSQGLRNLLQMLFLWSLRTASWGGVAVVTFTWPGKHLSLERLPTNRSLKKMLTIYSSSEEVHLNNPEAISWLVNQCKSGLGFNPNPLTRACFTDFCPFPQLGKIKELLGDPKGHLRLKPHICLI